MATKKSEKLGEWFKIPVNPVHPGVYKRRYEGESDTHYAVYADRQWVNMDRLANVQWGRLPVGSGAESDDPPRIEYIDKPMTRAELQADSDRLNRQVIADLQQCASVLCGMPLPVGSAIESATEGLPPKPYPPGPYPPPAPPPLAAHRMVSVKDDHAVHGPDGLRIFAGRGHKGKWRAEIIAAALDGRWADAQWAKGVIDE